MDKAHFIFLHESEENKPIVINSVYTIYAVIEDEHTKVVQYDYYENMIFDSDIYVNETPEKIFTLVDQEDFVLLHCAEDNAVILVRCGAIISLIPTDDGTTMTLIGGESFDVNETPMSIREISISGKQAKAIRPSQKVAKKAATKKPTYTEAINEKK